MSGHVCGTNVRGVYFGEPMVGTKVGGGDAVRGDMTEPAANPPRHKLDMSGGEVD